MSERVSKIVKKGTYVYVFRCPIHGLEETAYCFRAFWKANEGLWEKYSVRYTSVDLPPEELGAFLRGFRAARSSMILGGNALRNG